jgi:hypothetical protein
MQILAKGNFDVKLVPQTDREIAGLARMTIDKEFFGELEASSQGQMLSARTNTDNSAGYVAIERVEGILQGRKGSFILQHTGTMNRGKYELTVHVVPDSGTGELTGISGVFYINIVDKKHYYELNYELPL